MDNNILCQKKEQTVLTDFFENVSKIIRECDDCEEKEKIKKILHSMNEPVSYIFLGEQGVGKTTLLKVLLSNIFVIQEEMQGISVIDTRGLNQLGENLLSKARELTAECQAILVVLDAGRINSLSL